MPHTVCSFNVNNLFVRYRFGSAFPGGRDGGPPVPAYAGFLPANNPENYELFRPAQRELAAKVILGKGGRAPDTVCLQEVETLQALRVFNEAHLGGTYPYALVVDSRDYRNIDVGILSRLEVVGVRTHVDDLDPKPDDPAAPWLFSRDCLEVALALGGKGSATLTLFVNHFKSKFIPKELAPTPGDEEMVRLRDDALRTRQAERVAAILRERFPGPAYENALFAVVGDLNDHAESQPLRPLRKGAGLVDALSRLRPEDRWTHWWGGKEGGGSQVSQLDHVLFSPALDRATVGTLPRIERRGIAVAAPDPVTGSATAAFHHVEDDPAPMPVDVGFPRFPGVTEEAFASDHAAVFFEVP